MEHVFNVPIYSLIPFILMLASIAVLPLIAHHFWESNRNKLIVSLILGIPVAIWLLVFGMSHELSHVVFFDYVPFIILLGALFVITGGIFVEGDINPTPKNNTILLAIGAVLASFMGTTGAAMLLIRPLIKMNKRREYKVHTILFFIAVAANCGGLLTPLGDPPLFMMYLRGASFFWFFDLFKFWAFVNIFLLIIYYVVDNIQWKKELAEVKDFVPLEKVPVKIYGKLNLLWLIGVVLAVAMLNQNYLPFISGNKIFSYVREIAILLMAVLSLVTTAKVTRQANRFSWEPIEEVAYLFIGIFITMVPALLYLETHAADLGIDSPHLFYYATGALSGFLDNTPTAVTFYSLAVGLVEQDHSLLVGIESVAGIPYTIMEAISVASVFFGSMTYIGNGPNFMVKAIAESQEIKMPDFFSYMIKFSLIVLLPLFILAQLLFIPM